MNHYLQQWIHFHDELHTAEDLTSKAKTILIYGYTELVSIIHAGRKMIGQTMRIRLPLSLWQATSLPMPNLSVINI